MEDPHAEAAQHDIARVPTPNPNTPHSHGQSNHSHVGGADYHIHRAGETYKEHMYDYRGHPSAGSK